MAAALLANLLQCQHHASSVAASILKPHLLAIMLAKLSLLLKIILLFLALSFLLFSITFDFSHANPYILNSAPSSDGQSTNNTDNTEKLTKESATASDLPLAIQTTTAATENASPITLPPPPVSPALRDGNATLLEMVPAYIKAIMDPEDTTFPRLECPIPNDQRYQYLKGDPADELKKSAATSRPRYFFALNLHQRASLLPDLFGAIVESIRFLGPEDCAVSVIEGRSDDGTFEILLSLREEIESMGAKYYFNTGDINPPAADLIKSGDRVKLLAELRNQALQPLLDCYHKASSTDDTTIIFLNDVAICSEDILELIHQRHYQSADMTCGMDWTYVGPDPTFYDVWIARGMTGDTFFQIPPDGSWDSAWNIFWNDPGALESVWAGKPFQVFSCWNGAAAFTAKPFLERRIKFRSSGPGECPGQGEPSTWCGDMWRLGYGRIAVVPVVNIEYGDEAAMRIKGVKGYVSNFMGEGAMDERIVWEEEPPERVKCMPSYDHQVWLPWDGRVEEGEERAELV